MNQSNGQIGWGIVGTSPVSLRFCSQLKSVGEASIRHVVGSNREKAESFSKQLAIPRHADKLDALLEDESVSIIYIATPTRLHVEQARVCLEAGKSVLCEKPFSTDPEALRSLQKLAAQRGLFCMEGMWMRFNPLVQQARELVNSNALGKIRLIRASVGYAGGENRLVDPQRGPAWDYAVYALSLFQFILGPPNTSPSISGFQNGRGSFSASLAWPESGAVLSLSASVECELANEAEVIGSKGRLILGAPFFGPSRLWSSNPLFSAPRLSGPGVRILEAFAGKPVLQTRFQQLADPWSGFLGQAREATRCVAEGKQESALMPLEESIAVIGWARKLADLPRH